MQQYLDLLRTIIDEGKRKPTRTGIDTKVCFAIPFRHDLADGFPLLTTKKLSWKNILYELCWFLCGDTDVRSLQARKCHIWDEWADESGSVGPVYGKQWTEWETKDGRQINQLKDVIERLRQNPDDRRGVVTAWNAAEIPAMRLPPCHHTFQLLIYDGRLCCHMTQRSADSFLGVPYNIASYALLMHLVAKMLGIAPGILAITFVDAHLYWVPEDDPYRDEMFRNSGKPKYMFDSVAAAKLQLARLPRALPTIEIFDMGTSDNFDLFDWASHCLYGQNIRAEDCINVIGYTPDPTIPVSVAV